ncbi:hypothetical protein [Isoptericola halotolerans]|nr:hypothetical protein [Isoptericola halotolerans]
MPETTPLRRPRIRAARPGQSARGTNGYISSWGDQQAGIAPDADPAR